MRTIASLLHRSRAVGLRIGWGIAVSVTAILFVGTAAHADSFCRPVYGWFTSTPVLPPECESPVGFCTDGKLIGGVRGSYQFTMTSNIPSGEAGVPGVNFYTGHSVITTRRGKTITGTDTGTIDLDPFGSGKFAALITLTDGANGYLVLRGTLDFETGNASGDYRGEVCPF